MDELQTDETLELLKRVQADYENYRKRQEKEREIVLQNASADILEKLLPIVDNFQLALKNAPVNDFSSGITAIYELLLQLLEKEGITLMQTQQKTFDPYFHQALGTVESSEPKNTIVETIQQGYLFHGKVIRPAIVLISKGDEQ